MDEMNELTMVNENEAMNSEVETQETPDVAYVDGRVVLAVGAVGGALALKGAQMLWNSKPIMKVRTATADKLERVQENLKTAKEERQRKKLAKVKGEIIDAEVVPEKAVNE